MSEILNNIDPIAEYSKELAERFPPLPPEEADRLTAEMEAGSEEAKIHLVEANLSLVVSMAKRFVGKGVSEFDLIHEGNLALMKAADAYTNSCGRSFAYYAAHAIRKAMVATIAERRIGAPIPVKQIENANKVMRVYRSLEKELDRSPTVEDVAPYVDLSTEELTRIFNRCIEVPLEEAANMAQGENNSYMDELKAQFPNLLDIITPRERKVLELRFGLTDGSSHTLEEVATMIGVTRERVRYIESKALRRLQRTQHHTKKPQDFFN